MFRFAIGLRVLDATARGNNSATPAAETTSGQLNRTVFALYSTASDCNAPSPVQMS